MSVRAASAGKSSEKLPRLAERRRDERRRLLGDGSGRQKQQLVTKKKKKRVAERKNNERLISRSLSRCSSRRASSAGRNGNASCSARLDSTLLHVLRVERAGAASSDPRPSWAPRAIDKVSRTCRSCPAK